MNIGAPASAGSHTTRCHQAGSPAADALGDLVNQKSAEEFKHELEQQFEHSRGIVALAGQNEKAGKPECRSGMNIRQVFPPYQVPIRLLSS
jgi:hypothetical protein